MVNINMYHYGNCDERISLGRKLKNDEIEGISAKLVDRLEAIIEWSCEPPAEYAVEMVWSSEREQIVAQIESTVDCGQFRDKLHFDVRLDKSGQLEKAESSWSLGADTGQKSYLGRAESVDEAWHQLREEILEAGDHIEPVEPAHMSEYEDEQST
jgi:hypothetical protein